MTWGREQSILLMTVTRKVIYDWGQMEIQMPPANKFQQHSRVQMSLMGTYL